jgi:WD40 repeat protein
LTGDLLYKFTTAKKLAVTSLSYTPNGAHLAVGLASGEVQVFDIESSSCIFTLEPHNEVSGDLFLEIGLHAVVDG